MIPRHPDCDRDPSECALTGDAWIAGTPVEWTPHYDGNGKPLNADPNLHIRQYSCATCGREWGEAISGAEVAPYEGRRTRPSAPP
jgi:hypothetical protein